MRTIEAYQTSDGKIFECDRKAEAHQIDLIGELLDALFVDIGGNVTRVDRHRILMATIENKDRDSLIVKLYQAVSHN
jgi:hypothetical protein